MGLWRPTVGEAVQPVVAQVDGQEGEPPGPSRVPRQLHQTVVVPHVDVRGHFNASHEHPRQELERVSETAGWEVDIFAAHKLRYVTLWHCY